MKKEKKGLLADFSKWFYAVVLVGLLILVLLSLFYTKHGIKEARLKITETLEFLQTQCNQYDSLRTSELSQEMSLLGENTRAFAKSLERHPEDLTEEYLKEQAEDQELEGVLILDETMNPELTYSSQGQQDIYAMWEESLEQEQVQELLDEPGEYYMERQELDTGKAYKFAAVGRMDRRGIVFVYTEAGVLESDFSESLMADTLRKYEFGTDGKLFITDGDTVISSNEESLIGEKVSEISLLQNSSNYRRNTYHMLRGEEGDSAYLSCWTTYDDYYDLYAFYPQKDVYRERQVVVTNTAVVFVLALVILLVLHQKSAKAYVKELVRQNEIVRAISTVYTSNYVVDLEKQSAEVIKAPTQIVEGMKKSGKMNLLSDEMVSKYVAEPYRESFRRFVDARTMSERLEHAEYLTYTYEDCFGQWFLVILVPKRRDENGKVTAAVLVERDVTEQKCKEIEGKEKLVRAAQEARQANAAKTDFLRRISHDIRTPINGIRGMVEIGDYYADDLEKQAECRAKIRETSGFLLDLVNDVLDMNKLESGDIQLDQTSFDLKKLLSEVREIMEVQAEQKGIRFSVRERKGTHWNLVGSPLHLRQILINIIGNAVKYNKENGSVEIGAEEIQENEGKAIFRFQCEDTGIGMSEEFQKHIFEPFSQEHDSARTNYEGTGLGLPIVKKLVERMDGTLSFTSEKGKGSTFIITIPFEIDTQAQTIQKELTEQSQKSIEGKKVLLVEDNQLNMEIAEFMLEQQNMLVTKAWNGEEAVDLFAQSEPGTYDVILMDIMMPKMDGIQATKTIRAMERKDAKEIVILAMTANAFLDDIARNKAAGMNDQLSKPLDMKVMKQMLEHYIGK